MINHRNDTQQSGFGSIASWRSDLHFFDIGFCAVWSKLIIRSLICQQNTVFHIVRFPGLLSWKLPSTSMEASIYFYLLSPWKLPSNSSMEHSIHYLLQWKLPTTEYFQLHWKHASSHGSSSSFPWRTLAKYSSKSSRAASVTTAKGEASYRRSSVDLDPTGRWSTRCSWSDACRNWR